MKTADSNKNDEIKVKKIITIELLDEQFKFKTDENSIVDPQDIAHHLIEEITQVEAKFPVYARKTSKLAIVVMAALNIAKDNFELQNRHSTFINNVSTRAERLDFLIRSYKFDSMP